MYKCVNYCEYSNSSANGCNTINSHIHKNATITTASELTNFLNNSRQQHHMHLKLLPSHLNTKQKFLVLAKVEKTPRELTAKLEPF